MVNGHAPDTGGRWPLARFVLLVAFIAGTAVAGALKVRSAALPDPAAMRAAVEGFGQLGPLFYLGMLAFRPFLFLPGIPLMMAGGLAFGAGPGALLTTLGLVLAAATTHLLARLLGHDYVKARVGPRLARLSGSRAGAGSIFLLNLVPVVPLSVPNYLGGAACVPLPAFLAATGLGLIPRVAAWSMVGDLLVRPEAGALIAASAVLLGLALLPLASPSLRARLF